MDFLNSSNIFLNSTSHYLNIGSHNALSLLRDTPIIKAAVHGPIFPFIFFFHSILMCCRLRPLTQRQHWVYSYVFSWIAIFSGTILAHYLVGKVPAVLQMNVPTLIFTITWYIVNFSPFDIIYKIYNVRIVRSLLIVISTVNRSRSIFAGVDLVSSSFPGSHVFAMLCGILTGSSTVLVMNLISKQVIDHPTLSELSQPTWSLKSSFFISLAYYMCYVDASVTMPWWFDKPTLLHTDAAFMEYVKILLMAYLTVHAVLVEFFGTFTPPPINVLESLFFKISRISSNKHDPMVSIRSPPLSPRMMPATPHQKNSFSSGTIDKKGEDSLQKKIKKKQ